MFSPALNFNIFFQIAVFEVDKALLQEMSAAANRGHDMTKYKGRSTLRLIQSISTLPIAFPTTMNTCGRICVHNSGRFVVVSNRGHQSITVYKVRKAGPKKGELVTVGYFHTRGDTPRHYQFDNSGQYLLVANQDTDSLAVFSFNISTGEIKYTGNEYRVPSPNFVCSCPTYQEDNTEDGDVETPIPTHVTNQQRSEAISSWEASDSEDSTVPTTSARSKNAGTTSLEDKLAQAQLEIEELKKMLALKM
jgi:6-phosphogluconolactonase